MTESEWLVVTDTFSLVDFLRTRHRVNRTKIGRRKLRLFGCACCREAWPLFADEPECAELVQAAERFADGRESQHRLAHLDAALPALQSDGLGFHVFAVLGARLVASLNVVRATVEVAQLIAQGTRHIVSRSGVPELSVAQQAAILRDIFGNPFRPVTFSPEWRTATAGALARQMYEAREFSAMPILADALQDAGCNNSDILDHCRGPGPHVRGCWVVDLVLALGGPNRLYR
jgi:hypothetical protein